MNLNRRIDALEKVTTSEPRTLHVVTAKDDETPGKSASRYCLENNLDKGKLISGELGRIIQIVHV
jgi:hypothetical protein